MVSTTATATGAVTPVGLPGPRRCPRYDASCRSPGRVPIIGPHLAALWDLASESHQHAHVSRWLHANSSGDMASRRSLRLICRSRITPVSRRRRYGSSMTVRLLRTSYAGCFLARQRCKDLVRSLLSLLQTHPLSHRQQHVGHN